MDGPCPDTLRGSTAATFDVVRDQKPPRLLGGGERLTLRVLTQYQRESVVRKPDGVADDDARRELVPSGTSLLWIVKHLAKAELLWVGQRFAGRNVDLPGDTIEDADSIESVVAAYMAAWAEVDSITADASLD